jgi:hypothetical protein
MVGRFFDRIPAGNEGRVVLTRCRCVVFTSDKTRLADERKEAERELKDLKEAAGHRIRKVDVEELRRKAARLGRLPYLFGVSS